MTFRTLIDDAAERLNNLQPEARVRFRRYLNEWYHRILSEVNLPRGAETTLSVVAATDEYTIASTIGRIRQISDDTNALVLEERPLQWIRDMDPDESASGIPTYYAYITDRQIKLYPNPSANNTLRIDHDAVVTEMDDDADVPIIPEDFHYLLGLGIRINEYEKQDDQQRLRHAREEMLIGVGRLKYWLAARVKNVLNPGRAYSFRASRLGGWYPKGS